MHFAQIMWQYLWICMDKKVFSKVCIKLQCDHICFSGHKQYSVKVLNIQITWECHFSLLKNLSNAGCHQTFQSQIFQITRNISLGLLVMQTLHINNVFSIFLHIDTLTKSNLKLFQGFYDTVLYPENIFLSCACFGVVFR